MRRIPDCHPDRSYEARGFCQSCYQRWRMSRTDRPASCHPERGEFAKGLCNNCYQASTADRAKNAARERARRAPHLKGRTSSGLSPIQLHWRRKGISGAPEPVQHGLCEICGKESRMCLDHDHATGKARGWLCRQCNSGIGFLKDDPVILQKAIEYLGRNK